MGLFDLVFIVLVIAAVCALLTAAGLTVRGQGRRAGRILSRLFAGAVVYMLVVIAASVILPRRVMKVGDPQCFDDWCVSLAGVTRAPEGGRVVYSVDLLLSSRARRVAQRENNLAVYLTDDRGGRYDPVADRASVPFNVLLQPGESIVARRSFVVPADAAGIAAVITHEGGFPIGWFIIGYNTWFRKPPLTILG